MLRAGLIFLWFCAAFAAQPVLAAAPSHQPNSQAPAGLWLTANHNAVVEIDACGQDLCGRIVGLARGPGEPAPTDWQGVSQCGLNIIRTAPDSSSPTPAWNGSILDPRDGATYDARITMDPSQHLQLRGYIGMPLFGETQIWTRFDGQTGSQCQLSQGPGLS